MPIAIVRGRYADAGAHGAVAIGVSTAAIAAFNASTSVQSTLAAPATAVTWLGNSRIRSVLAAQSALLGIAPTLTYGSAHAVLVGETTPLELALTCRSSHAALVGEVAPLSRGIGRHFGAVSARV